MVWVCLSKHGNHQITKPSAEANSVRFGLPLHSGQVRCPSKPSHSMTESCGCAFPSGGFGGVISKVNLTLLYRAYVRYVPLYPTARQFPIPATFHSSRIFSAHRVAEPGSPLLPLTFHPVDIAYPSIELSFLSEPQPPFSSLLLSLPALASADERRGVRGRSQVAGRAVGATIRWRLFAMFLPPLSLRSIPGVLF